MIGHAAMVLLIVSLLSGCGSGSVCFGGDCDDDDDDDDDKTVLVDGNVDTVAPPNAVRDVVVFVYTGLDPSDLADGPPFDSFRDADAVVLDDDDAFSLDRIARGNLTLVVLLDDPEPDGTVDAGDECSVLRAGGDLDDIEGGRRVEIEDLDVDFRESSCGGNQPATGCGCADADDITVTLAPPDDGETNDDD